MTPSPPADPGARLKTAGDLYLAAADEWITHGETCDLDTCDHCMLLINRMKLARKVYQSSQHHHHTCHALNPPFPYPCAACEHESAALSPGSAPSFRPLRELVEALQKPLYSRTLYTSHEYDETLAYNRAIDAVLALLASQETPR